MKTITRLAAFLCCSVSFPLCHSMERDSSVNEIIDTKSNGPIKIRAYSDFYRDYMGGFGHSRNRGVYQKSPLLINQEARYPGKPASIKYSSPVKPAYVKCSSPVKYDNYKAKIIQIHNVSELETIVLPGDWVVLDLDKTLFTTGQKKYGPESILLNLDSKVIPLIANWRASYPESMGPSKEIKVIFLTARKNKHETETYEQLKRLGFPTDIEVIFAPNIYGSRTTVPQKGNALVYAVNSSSEKPRRIIMVDDLPENLVDVKKAFDLDESLSKIPLKLFQRKTNYKLYESINASEKTFPDHLNSLKYSHHLEGGSGGVHVLSSQSGQEFTLKCVTNSDQMKEEILADALYRCLDIPVPAFAIYDHLPLSLKNEKDYLSSSSKDSKEQVGPGPYRLASFIPSHVSASSEAIKKEIQKHFIVDAFLSNWDIVTGHFKNVILDPNGKLWRIDNGGSLRYRAVGGRKIVSDTWDSFKVSEIETMRNSQLNRDGAIAYGDLTFENLKNQAQFIFNSRENLFETLDKVSKQLDIDKPWEIKEMLRRRLDDLVHRFQLTLEIPPHISTVPLPTTPYLKRSNLALTNRLAAEKSAAGIFIYSYDPNTKEPVIWAGKRRGHQWLCNPGGKCDVNVGTTSDKTLADTAVREVQEESLGMLSFTALELAQCPSHDIINSSGVFYRMYIAFHPYQELKVFQNATAVQAYHWEAEYTSYHWIPLAHLIEGLQTRNPVVEEGKKTIKIQGDLIIYPPMLEMLEQPQVMDLLFKIKKNQKLTSCHTHREKTMPLHPLSFEEENQQLSQKILKQDCVFAQLKDRFSKINIDVSEPEHDAKIMSMKGFIPDEDLMKSREILLKAPYTQTEIYLASVMGEDTLNKIKDNPADQVNLFLDRHSQLRLYIKNDDYYKSQLVKALESEKDIKNRGKAVFYHGTDPMTCFIFDVYTLFRSKLKMMAPKSAFFRGIEEPFASILDVETFINKFRNSDGKVYNYLDKENINYADMGLSVNPFLFGNDGNATNASYYLFYSCSSVDAPDHEKLFDAFTSATGIPGKFQNYKALYQQYYCRNNQINSKLFQIFIDQQVVDTVAYTAVSGGDVVHLTMEDQSLYHGFANILGEMRSTIGAFGNRLRDGKSTKHTDITLNTIQGRLFLKPEIFHNISYVKTNSYWRYEIPMQVETFYLEKLSAQVSQDLSQWLLLNDHDDAAFSEGIPKLKVLHTKVYEGILGLKYIQSELVSKQKLPVAITKGNILKIQKIIDKWPGTEFSQGIPVMTYRKNKSTTLPVWDFVPNNIPNLLELIRCLLKNGAPKTEAAFYHAIKCENDKGQVPISHEFLDKLTSVNLGNSENNLSLINLAEFLKADKTVQTITLSFAITNEQLGYFMEALTINTTLRCLDLTKTPIITPDPIIKMLTVNTNLAIKILGDKLSTTDIIRLLHYQDRTFENLWMYLSRDSHISELSENITQNKYPLTTLNLSHVFHSDRIGDERAIVLANALKTNTTITSINLTNQLVTRKGMIEFLDILQENKTIQKIVFDQNLHYAEIAIRLLARQYVFYQNLWSLIVRDEGAMVLADFIKKGNIGHLRTLELSNSAVSDKGVVALAEALKTDKTITSLDLSHNAIKDAGAIALGDMLKVNPLITLKFDANSMSVIGIINLFPHKDRVPLDLWKTISITHKLSLSETINASLLNTTTLCLKDKSVEHRGISDLSEILKTNNTITSLDLSNNVIGDLGAAALAKMLEVNTTLTKLTLWANSLGDVSATTIAESLKINTGLKVLTLWQNNIGDEGVKNIGEMLKVNKTLTSLTLSRNNITSQGISYLANGLKDNNTLETIKLGRNKFGDSGATELLFAVSKNSSLLLLKLENNDIGDSTIAEISKMLGMNTTLKILSLKHNKFSDKVKNNLQAQFKDRIKI